MSVSLQAGIPQASIRTEAERAVVRPTPIPPQCDVRGPRTRQLQRRSLLLLAAVQLAGLAIAALSASVHWQAFGMGLLFPAGGFLFAGHWLTFIAGVAGFLMVGLTFYIGNLIGPLLLWLAMAVVAALIVDAPWLSALWVLPGVVVAVAGGAFWRVHRQDRAERARRAIINKHLATADRPLTRSAPALLGEELSEPDLAHVQYVLNRALQPVGEFQGFDLIEQVGGASLRYQLTFAEIALAAYQQAHVPAFGGYLHLAQRNLMEKMQDRRVWSYWFYENLFGNLSLDPDPIRKDNVMYSGWYGAMLGLYATTTGDTRYNQPGSISLRWNDRKTFQYDYPRLNDILYRQHRETPDNCIPCEPGWVAPMCNGFTMVSLRCGDRLRGTNHFEELKPFVEQSILREYSTADGRVLTVRNGLTGVPFIVPVALAGDGLNILSLHPVLPEVAERSWEILRARYLQRSANGEYRFDTQSRHEFDLGNLSRSGLMPLAMARLAAAEMGDREAADALGGILAQRYPMRIVNGEATYGEGSVSTHFWLAAGRMLRAGGYYDLVHHGIHEKFRDGPVLAEVAYPDVLVARAVATNGVLDLVLYSGGAVKSQRLRFSGLQPSRPYRISGDCQSSLMANAEGRAEAMLTIAGRTALKLEPAG